MKEQVLEIVRDEINEKLKQIRNLPIDNMGGPNTELHFKTAEMGAMQQILRRLEREL